MFLTVSNQGGEGSANALRKGLAGEEEEERSKTQTQEGVIEADKRKRKGEDRAATGKIRRWKSTETRIRN